MNIQRKARARVKRIPGVFHLSALLVVDSNNKFISEGIKVYGQGKKMADVLNRYDAR